MTQLVKASTQLATTLGIEPAMMIETIKAQCFPNMRPEQISDAQLAAFVSVANTLELNPLVPGMLYAYPQRNGGITPVTGPDGTFKKLGEMKGVTYECEVFPEDVSQKPTHAKASIYVEGKERPHTYTAIFSEWVVGANPNWSTRPRHMLWLRALKQCARQVIHGLPMDEDEVALAGLKNVTPEAAAADTPPERTAPPPRERGVAASRAAANKKSAPVVDAEVVDPAPATAAQAAAPAPTPQAEAPAPAPVAAPQPAPVEQTTPPPAQESKPAASATPSVTALQDGQRITLERVEIEQFVFKPINNQPSVEARVKGAFNGTVYHLGGSQDPSWQLDKPVTVTLLGKKLKSGAVVAMVEKVEVSSEGSALELN